MQLNIDKTFVRMSLYVTLCTICSIFFFYFLFKMSPQFLPGVGYDGFFVHTVSGSTETAIYIQEALVPCDCRHNIRLLLPSFSERDATKPKYDHEGVDRSEVADGYAPPPLVPTPATSHFPVPSLSSTITVIAPSHHHGNNSSSSNTNSGGGGSSGGGNTESWPDMRPDHPFPRGPPPPPQQPRKRCRDYDGEGWC